jgi:hypothetical protein
MKRTRRAAAALAVAVGLAIGGPVTPVAVEAQETQGVGLAPTAAGTAHQHRCGEAVLSTPGTECQGFAGRELLEDPGIFVVGYESNQDVSEKHVYQAVASFDLAPLRSIPNARLQRAALAYSEASTTRRSPAGESEYGILPTCNTQLGVPADGWSGGLSGVVPNRPAAVAGAAGATTGDSGSWDVTPQVEQWLASGANQGTFVMRGDDESLDVKGQAMCLSYVIDLSLEVEYTVGEE